MHSRREFILRSALAVQLPPSAATSPLLDRPRLGAEFFLNETETRQSVDLHFVRMAETGLTIARIFTLWDQIERERGVWDFTRYDWIYDAAAKNNILVANTLCSEDPPGWMGAAPFYHAWRDLENPALRPFSEIYLEKVVTHYKDHPAHGVWLLQNEPGIREDPAPYVLASYANWLERKYGTVDALNKVWYKQLRRFEDVTLPAEPRVAGWADFPSNLDWRRFRCDHLAAQLTWIHTQIDRHHPGALTHINPPGLTSNMPGSGRDMWKMKPAAHFAGASMHASWHFGMFDRDDFGVAYAYCCDLIRSVSAPAPWWVTELQAGPTIFTGSRPLNPTGGEITRWLWDGLGNGARGIVFWLWHPRTEGNEAGEWGLAGPNGEPTDRTRATQAVAQALDRHSAFFRGASPVPARAAILYPRDAMILYAVDGWRRPTDELVHSILGCYKALNQAHVPVDFLDVSELESGAASRYRVLYLPYCFALSARSTDALREFVRNGGTVWADGLICWKDEQGRTLQMPPGPLSDVFGFTLDDLDAAWEPFPLTTAGDKAGELWRCLIPQPAGLRTLLSAPGGRPAATENSFGKGRAIYYGTALTLGFQRRPNRSAGEWIAAPAISASADLPIHLAAAPDRVVFRSLQAPGEFAAVLNNWGPAGRAALHAPPATRSAVEIISGVALPVADQNGRAEVQIDLAAGSTAFILFR
jgi:beta-galactosidase